MRRAVAASVACAWFVLGASPAAALTCEPSEGHAREAIRSGWPPDAPHEFVFIATIGQISPVKGDSHTWGDIVEIRVDAVLRGELPLATTELYNPPLDASGWGPFRSGGQYLIAANPSAEDTPGHVYTFMCAPNEEITTARRFHELIAYSDSPTLADTALPVRGFDPSGPGWFLAADAVVVGIVTLARSRVGQT